jgi:NAD(P)-dependent dehydrogenase (short-subunit alcohol dehydrogenase family)
MKIIIVGASGTIGKKVTTALKDKHEVITAGSKSGDIPVDFLSTKSIKTFYEKIGSFDALISIAGEGYYGPLNSASPEDFKNGLNSKLLGQINLVLIGQHYINPKGSFTITSGILSDDPVLNCSSLSTINGGLNSFVKAAAIELEHGVRINAISPGVVEDSPEYFDVMPGHVPVSMDRVVAGYIKSVLGFGTGKVIEIF